MYDLRFFPLKGSNRVPVILGSSAATVAAAKVSSRLMVKDEVEEGWNFTFPFSSLRVKLRRKARSVDESKGCLRWSCCCSGEPEQGGSAGEELLDLSGEREAVGFPAGGEDGILGDEPPECLQGKDGVWRG